MGDERSEGGRDEERRWVRKRNRFLWGVLVGGIGFSREERKKKRGSWRKEATREKFFLFSEEDAGLGRVLTWAGPHDRGYLTGQSNGLGLLHGPKVSHQTSRAPY
jgi:hypothetical protein